MRGLKSCYFTYIAITLLSHPAWDAWIEMDILIKLESEQTSHPAWDAWIEIDSASFDVDVTAGRIPHGMRGLK